jgi:hypothetical protein
MRRADLILGLLLASTFGYMLIDLRGMRWETAVAPGLSALAGLLLGAHHLVTTGRALWRGDPGDGEGQEALYDREDLVPILGFLAAVLMVLLLGFAVGGALFVFLSVLAATRGRWTVALICAAPVHPFFAIGIDRGLGIMMFEGLLVRWLAG